eukprot:jgi/Ulvmu1/11519/UM078_0008.1
MESQRMMSVARMAAWRPTTKSASPVLAGSLLRPWTVGCTWLLQGRQFAQVLIERLRTSVGAKPAAGIMLLGKSGTGKSSFLNTITSALASAHVQQAGVGVSTRSFTSSVRLHTVRHDHRFAQWSVADTPGDIFDEVPSLYSRMLLGCMQQQAYDDKVRAVLLSPMQQLSRHSRIGCVLVVLAADEVWEAAQANKEAEDMPLAIPKGHIIWELCQVAKDLHAKLEGISVRMGCVITKLDTVQPAPTRDTRGMPRSRLARMWKPQAHMPQGTRSGIQVSAPSQRLRQLVASEIGIPKNMVFPLVNAVAVEDLPENLGLQYQALRCASECLDTARAANDEAAQATGSLRDCSSGSDMEG